MKITIKTLSFLLLLNSCANIVAPTGGKKDVDPPKVLSFSITENNKRDKTLAFEFNEYIQLNKWQENFFISPPTKKNIQKKINGKTLNIFIPNDLEKKETYYVSLNSCIKDNNEGNVLEELDCLFFENNMFDTLSFSGNLKDAYTLDPIENAWVMIFNKKTNDSLLFRSSPNYIAKTNKTGDFHFPNLKDTTYKIIALTGFDFIYNVDEKIAFSKHIITPKKDSSISLFAFDPIIKRVDSTEITPPQIDSTQKNLATQQQTGKIEVVTQNNFSCILQLLQNEIIIKEKKFNEKPYIINDILPGKYQLKYIQDENLDGIWNTGNWEVKISPEKVINYPSEIIIRANWDLILDWAIEE